MENKMLQNIFGLIKDSGAFLLGYLAVSYKLLLINIDQPTATIIVGLGAVVLGRVLDWVRDEYKNKKKRRQKPVYRNKKLS